MKILITGATGFIGSHLVKRLVAEGHDVACLVRKTSKIDQLKELGVKIIVGDLKDYNSLKDIPKGLQVVYHLAAYVDFSAVSGKAYQEMIEANVTATENLCKIVHEQSPKLKKFILFSSLAAVGFQRGVKVTNKTKPEPDTLYGETKYKSELIFLKYMKMFNYSYAIIKPSLVYGKNDFTSDFLKSTQMIKKGFFPIFGNGKNTMSPVIYIEDLIEICIRFMSSKTSGSYICCNDEKFSINEFVQTISALVGKKFGAIKIPVLLGQLMIFPIEILCKILNKPAPLNRRRVKDLSINRQFSDIHNDLLEAINYFPKTSLKDGAEKVIKWYKKEKLI